MIALEINQNSAAWSSIVAVNSLQKHEAEKTANLLFGTRGHFYLFYHLRENGRFVLSENCMKSSIEDLNISYDDWRILMSALTNSSGGDRSDWPNIVLGALASANKVTYKVDLIPALRSVREIQRSGNNIEGETHYHSGIIDHSGVGLIDELRRLQSPGFGGEKDRERFNNINSFLREITGSSTAQIEIPYNSSTILVNIDDRPLPFEAPGSGIEELIIIATKSTIFDNQIICIEEPELHLHPSLQKKLLRYLYLKTNNQYFITTHSASLIDACPCSVYHVWVDGGTTKGECAIENQHKFQICTQMGYLVH